MELGPISGAAVEGGTPKPCDAPEPNAGSGVPTAQLLPAMTHSVPCLAPVLAASTAAHNTGRGTSTRPRLSMEEFLPADVLEVVLGLLDRETLCTARLVSKAFCAAASANICSFSLQRKSYAVSRHHFPRLGCVTLNVSPKGEGLAQVDPSMRELVTALTLPWARAEDHKALITETLSHLSLLPKLRELDVGFGTESVAELLRQYTNLQIIRISGACKFPVAGILGAMTSLRELRVNRVHRPGNWAGDFWDRPSADASWLQAPALRNLQALHIITPGEALPLIGSLTGLTGLTWVHETLLMEEEAPYSIAPLTRLTLLRSVSLRFLTSESNVDIACSLGLGSLADLAIGASCNSGRFLTRQTALTRLTVDEHLINLRHSGALRLELLQSLQLQRLTAVGADGVSALHKAPSLSRLHIGIVTDDALGMGRALLDLPALGLSQALAGLSQLRDLWLGPVGGESPAKFLDYALALGPLTGLTGLLIFWGKLDNQDLRALLGLTRLRRLYLSHSCLTDDVVPELAVLTNLNSLGLRQCGVTSLAPVTDVLNPLRTARGWPPMRAYIFND